MASVVHSSNTDAVVHFQAQAAVSQPSVATPAFAEPVQGPARERLHGRDRGSTRFHGLQGRAHAGLQATAQILQEQAGLVSQAASERVKTARAGKSFLDAGGEISAQTVLAKKAPIDASDADKIVVKHVELAIMVLDGSVAKLKIAEEAECDKQARQRAEITDDHEMAKIAAEYEERATALRQISHMLETPASSAQMGPEEFDALAIVQAKEGCATVMSKTSAGLDKVRHKTLAGMSSVSAAPKDKIPSVPEASAPVSPAPTLLGSFRQKASSNFAWLQQAANDRAETARAGKNLLDDGGDAGAHRVIAKKSTVDAADIDRKVARQVQLSTTKLNNSAAKLTGIRSAKAASDILSRDSAEKLADEHRMRAKIFRQVAEMFKDPISA